MHLATSARTAAQSLAMSSARSAGRRRAQAAPLPVLPGAGGWEICFSSHLPGVKGGVASRLHPAFAKQL